MIRTAAATLMMTLGFAVIPAYAAESPATVAAAVAVTASASASASELATDTDWTLAPVKMGAVKESRGALLPTLYVSLAALNAYDFASTRKGISMGATEANPAMQAVVGNTTTLMAVKALATAGTIVTAEQLWKNHHKGQAIAVMLISNGLMSAVAAHNNSIVSHLGR